MFTTRVQSAAASPGLPPALLRLGQNPERRHEARVVRPECPLGDRESALRELRRVHVPALDRI